MSRLHYARPVVVTVRRPPTSENLARACVSGDRLAWAELHRRYQRLVRAEVTRRALALGRGGEVEDALQEFWAGFPALLAAWRPNRATLSTWLSWRARNHFDRCLRDRPASELLFERGRSAPESPEAQVLAADLAFRVRVAAFPVARTERDQAILGERLLAADPLTTSAIAAAWGVTRQAVEQVQARLLARLAPALLPLAA